MCCIDVDGNVTFYMIDYLPYRTLSTGFCEKEIMTHDPPLVIFIRRTPRVVFR
jgi:hypothetical protein